MGHYYYHREEGRLFIKMQGKMKYTSSIGFDKFINEYVTGDTESVLIDLQNVEYIDSTNLGLIARIAEQLRVHEKSPLMLLSTRTDINELLSSLGFDQFCTIVSKFSEEIEYDAVPVKTGSEGELLKMMINSHKKLIVMNEENSEIFKDVIELMEKDIET